jgi:hypothetical protein
MNVNHYIFQSPYNSQVQVGRLDKTTQDSSLSQTVEDNKKTSDDTSSFDKMATQKAEEVSKIKFTDSSLLDTYA